MIILPVDRPTAGHDRTAAVCSARKAISSLLAAYDMKLSVSRLGNRYVNQTTASSSQQAHTDMQTVQTTLCNALVEVQLG